MKTVIAAVTQMIILGYQMKTLNKFCLFITSSFRYVSSKVDWIVWDLSGARFVYQKFHPLTVAEENRPKYRKPSTFTIWLLALYLAAFMLAAQKFENRLDKVEHKTNILVAQLGTNQFPSVMARVPWLQAELCPIKPEFFNYETIIASLFASDGTCDSVVKELKGIVSSWKLKLQGVDLSGVDLSSTDLSDAQLSLANLSSASLAKTDLKAASLNATDFNKAILHDANLSEATLNNANFTYAYLQRAYLNNANLQGADFSFANLSGVDFSGANLSESKGLTVEQLLTVASLYNVKGLDPKLKNELEQRNSKIFQQLGG